MLEVTTLTTKPYSTYLHLFKSERTHKSRERADGRVDQKTKITFDD